MFDTLWLDVARTGIIILTLLLAWSTYQSNLLLQRYRPEFNLLLSPPETAMRLVLVGLCFALAWLTGLPAGQLGLVSEAPWREIVLGVAAGVIIQLMANLLTQWAVNRFGTGIYSTWVILNILPRRPIEWVLVPLAFIPAVALEELLFRTLWLGAFGDLLPLWLLIAATSLVFGVMHVPQGRLGMLVAGGANVILSLLFISTGTLLVPLIAHYVVNLLQLVVAYRHREALAAQLSNDRHDGDDSHIDKTEAE